MRSDAQALRQLFHLAKPPGFRHRRGGDIADGDIAAFGNELPREFAAHACAAPGYDSDFSGEVLHASHSFRTRTILKISGQFKNGDLAAAHAREYGAAAMSGNPYVARKRRTALEKC